MDIRKIFNIFIRWIWLLFLGGLIAAGVGYYLSIQETPMYRTSTRFVVLRAASTGYYDYYAYIDYQQLISTYAQLLSMEALLSQVSQEVGFPVYPNQATAEQIEDTQFVRLTVTHEDPVKAGIIANTLVRVLIEQNEALQSVRYETTEKNYQVRADQAMEQIQILQDQIRNLSVINLEEQIVQVQSQIDELQSQATDLEFNIAQLDVSFPTEEQTLQRLRYQAELSEIRPLLDQYQEIYTNLVVMGEPMENENARSTRMAQLERTLDLYEQIYFNSISSLESLNLTQVQNTPNVVHVEPAVIPNRPFSPRPFTTAALYGAVGLLAMGGVAFLIEYLDDTIKTSEDVKGILGLPVLGLVSDMNGSFLSKNDHDSGPYVINQPRSPIAEAFRSLRTNLAYYSVDHPLGILLVTSSAPEEGKTTIASNLAAIYASSNNRVLLIDADMRVPNIHNHLNLQNRQGLSDLIMGRFKLSDVLQKVKGNDNLTVITSGSLPPNPAELLGTEKWSQILKGLSNQFDMIIIDSPPAIVTDAQILGTMVDGVVYVVRSGKTRSPIAKITTEEFQRVGAKLVGVVINQTPRSRESYYGGSKYYGRQISSESLIDHKFEKQTAAEYAD